MDLAFQGLGKVFPNPMVGCIIEHQGQIIGKGFHEDFGGNHAEVNAINSVAEKDLLAASTLYVNLEPCCHTGKTPPCTARIIESGIKKVIIANRDPNPIISGKGIEFLKKNKIHIEENILAETGRDLNRRFFTFHEKRRPYIILKWAQTADGFVDHLRISSDVAAKKISNSASHNLVQQWRGEEQSVMVGTGTVLLDNPRLTLRNSSGRKPWRITIDRNSIIDDKANILDGSAPTIIFSNQSIRSQKGIHWVSIDFNRNILSQIMAALYERQIGSVIVEGGPTLLGSFLNENLWDEIRLFTSHEKIHRGVKAPHLPLKPVSSENLEGDSLQIFRNV